jgi:hypothetical protein
MVSAGDVQMTRMENISTSDSAAFKANVRSAYDAAPGARAKEPYIVVIAYTDHLAVMDAGQVIRKAGVVAGAGDVEIPIVNAGGQSKFLWQDIVSGEGWFVQAMFVPDGGGALPITADKVQAVPRSTATPSMSRKVKVDVSGLPAGTGTIFLVVNVVNRMRGGLSFRGANLICVCTKAWWTQKSAASQNQVIIHELGHQYAMVADGTGTGPDRVATQYAGSGHVGNHCHNGVAAQANYGAVTGATCVMFGATNAPTSFCGNCAPAVKKQDFSGGFGSL